MVYTSDALLSSIERKSFAPNGQVTFSPSDILLMSDEALLSVIFPKIINTNEEYFVLNKEYSITADQSSYEIPSRAIGSIARSVQILDENGVIRSIPRLEPDDQVSTVGGSLRGYFIKDSKIVLDRTPDRTSGTLRVPYFIQPGALVLASSGAVISAIDPATKVVTVSTIPSSWNTGDSFDLISCKGSHAYRDIDLVSTMVNGNDITLPSLPSDLVVGDYINQSEESSLVQVPSPFRAVLAQFVAAEIIGNQNQPNGQKAMDKAVGLLGSALELISDRVKGSVRAVQIENWF